MGKNYASVIVICEKEEKRKIDEKVKICYGEIIKPVVDKLRESTASIKETNT